MKRIAAIFFVVVMILLPITVILGWMSYINITRFYYVVSERSWPSIEAVIISSETEWHSPKGGKIWAPVWKFSYSVNGKSYVEQSNSLQHGYNAHWYDTEALAFQAGLVRAHATIVTAYYDPNSPERSVLDRATWNAEDWYILSLSIFSFIVAGQLLQKGYARRDALRNNAH